MVDLESSCTEGHDGVGPWGAGDVADIEEELMNFYQGR
jgi:hypothetical protein